MMPFMMHHPGNEIKLSQLLTCGILRILIELDYKVMLLHKTKQLKQEVKSGSNQIPKELTNESKKTADLIILIYIIKAVLEI